MRLAKLRGYLREPMLVAHRIMMACHAQIVVRAKINRQRCAQLAFLTITRALLQPCVPQGLDQCVGMVGLVMFYLCIHGAYCRTRLCRFCVGFSRVKLYVDSLGYADQAYA